MKIGKDTQIACGNWCPFVWWFEAFGLILKLVNYKYNGLLLAKQLIFGGALVMKILQNVDDKNPIIIRYKIL